jgi:hypothetical protein
MIYIIGPISGRPEANRPAFEKARQDLRKRHRTEKIIIPHGLYTQRGNALQIK